jgi:hypothetical protein
MSWLQKGIPVEHGPIELRRQWRLGLLQLCVATFLVSMPTVLLFTCDDFLFGVTARQEMAGRLEKEGVAVTIAAPIPSGHHGTSLVTTSMQLAALQIEKRPVSNVQPSNGNVKQRRKVIITLRRTTMDVFSS